MLNSITFSDSDESDSDDDFDSSSEEEDDDEDGVEHLDLNICPPGCRYISRYQYSGFMF